MCLELGIPDVTEVKATKQEFKAMVKEACPMWKFIFIHYGNRGNTKPVN